ncbi:MAG: ABC transporter permease subunit [Planctomycetes bacterium]|nr:ABC transporter permease subunit [Planctomycetota bacterium]
MANDAISNLGKWFWYLVPANPILVRVVQGGSKRTRHAWFRFGYLLVLFAVLLLTYLTYSSGMSGSLSDVAKTSTQIFRLVAYAQLLMMCFLAPIFTAGAITQERDSETFNVLLTTPLSNAQIIFGTLLSRLFFVLVLLFSGMPIFCITMIYGGVTFSQITLSFAIAGATAVVTGSLAIMMSMIRVGTRRTIFSFVMAIGLYLLVVLALAQLPSTWVAEAAAKADGPRQMSWLAPFHPYLSLEVGLSEVPAPSLADVAHYGWPAKHLLAYPHVSYVVMTLLLSLLMVTFSMLFVRSGAKEGEPTLLNKLTARFRRRPADAGERRRKPHKVWANPLAWREATTKASAASSVVSRYGMLIGGAVVALVILLYLINGWPVIQPDGTSAAFVAADARMWLMWLVTVEAALILLVVTNAAATSMTKERESNTMDILLTTPLTSNMIVWGKLRGLIAFAMPMLAVPVFSLLLFVAYDAFKLIQARMSSDSAAAMANLESVINFEAVVLLAMVLLVNTALAAVIGLNTSLKSKKSVKAVIVGISIVAVINALAFVIVNSIVANAPQVGPFFAPFTPFTAVKGLINGVGTRDFGGYTFTDRASVRILTTIGGCVAVGIYALIVAGMHKALVRNFHMTVRKQTAS